MPANFWNFPEQLTWRTSPEECFCFCSSLVAILYKPNLVQSQWQWQWEITWDSWNINIKDVSTQINQVLSVVNSKRCTSSSRAITCDFNLFGSSAPLLYPMKTKNLKVFWSFQEAEKGCIGNKLVNPFQANVPFLQLLKTSKNFWFRMFFRGYKFFLHVLILFTSVDPMTKFVYLSKSCMIPWVIFKFNLI